MSYVMKSKADFFAEARRLAAEIAGSVGVILSDEDENYYAEQYSIQFPRYGSEMPIKSRMMSIICNSFAG